MYPQQEMSRLSRGVGEEGIVLGRADGLRSSTRSASKSSSKNRSSTSNLESDSESESERGRSRQRRGRGGGRSSSHASETSVDSDASARSTKKKKRKKETNDEMHKRMSKRTDLLDAVLKSKSCLIMPCSVLFCNMLLTLCSKSSLVKYCSKSSLVKYSTDTQNPNRNQVLSLRGGKW